jgi:hypothetical protein
MSRRNRMVLTAIGLLAALSLVPAPSHAVGLWESGIPLASTLEQAWSWLTGHLPGATPQERTAPWRKEGGAINPNGNSLTLPLLPLPPLDNADEGGAINPNGHD